MKLELFNRSPQDADFVKGGYHYSKADILKELEEHAIEEYAMSATKQEILDLWQSLLDEYDIITEDHKEKAIRLMQATFKQKVPKS